MAADIVMRHSTLIRCERANLERLARSLGVTLNQQKGEDDEDFRKRLVREIILTEHVKRAISGTVARGERRGSGYYN